MPSIKITEEMQDAFSDECPEDVGFEFISEGDWSDDGKYQHAETIYRDNETGKYYSYYLCRSGSYFTDWDYQIPDTMFEVVPVEVKTITYKAVK